MSTSQTSQMTTWKSTGASLLTSCDVNTEVIAVINVKTRIFLPVASSKIVLIKRTYMQYLLFPNGISGMLILLLLKVPFTPYMKFPWSSNPTLFSKTPSPEWPKAMLIPYTKGTCNHGHDHLSSLSLDYHVYPKPMNTRIIL